MNERELQEENDFLKFKLRKIKRLSANHAVMAPDAMRRVLKDAHLIGKKYGGEDRESDQDPRETPSTLKKRKLVRYEPEGEPELEGTAEPPKKKKKKKRTQPFPPMQEHILSMTMMGELRRVMENFRRRQQGGAPSRGAGTPPAA